MADLNEIKWALGALGQSVSNYALAAAYYDGQQRLTFATEKFRNTFGRLFAELAINHCPPCVDILADRLQIEGFKTVNGDTPAIEAKTREIWRRNRMDKRAGEVHQESLKAGDAYIIVDDVKGKATIYPNMAGRCAVEYDSENPGYIKRAAKWWPEGVEMVRGQSRYVIRLNLYYQDRTEKYVTAPIATGALPLSANGFVPIKGDWFIPNPLGKVPVFHFANNAPIGQRGQSELRDVIPVQDALNKSVCDMLVSMEFNAYPQRYVVGLEIEVDAVTGKAKPPFQSGVDRLMVVPPQRDADGNVVPSSEAQPVTFGEFGMGNLAGFIQVKESFRQDFSVITGIPAHYFSMASGGFPSGESLKTAEARLTSKVVDRQIAFGNVWEDVMRLCLEIEGQSDVELETKWRDTGPRSVTEDIANGVQKQALGIPNKQIWAELGYSPEQIATLESEANSQAVRAVTASKMVDVPTVARD